MPISEFIPSSQAASTGGSVANGNEFIDSLNFWAEGGDGFGMLWGPHYGFDGSGTRPASDYDASADPDQDALENLYESYANTDPFDADSHLLASLGSSGANLELSWTGANGLDRYKLELPLSFSSYDPAALEGTRFAGMASPPLSAFAGAAPGFRGNPMRLTSLVPGHGWVVATQDFHQPPAGVGVQMTAGPTAELAGNGDLFLRWTGVDGVEYVVRVRLRIGDWLFGRSAFSASHTPGVPSGDGVYYRLIAEAEPDIETTFTFAESFYASQEDDADGDWDADGIPNGYEARFGLDPADDGDAFADNDSDALNNFEEYLLNTDPTEETLQEIEVNVVEPTTEGDWRVYYERWVEGGNPEWVEEGEIASSEGTYELSLSLGRRFRFNAESLDDEQSVPQFSVSPVVPPSTALGSPPTFWFAEPVQIQSSQGPPSPVFNTTHIAFELPRALLLNDNRDEWKGDADSEDESLMMVNPIAGGGGGNLIFNDLMGDRRKHKVVVVAPRVSELLKVPDTEFRLEQHTDGGGDEHLRFHALKTRDGENELLVPGLEQHLPLDSDITADLLAASAPLKDYHLMVEGLVEGVVEFRLEWWLNGSVSKYWPSVCNVLERQEAFAGAVGFGKWAIGGNAPNAKTVMVTSTGDYDQGSEPEEGTLRWALNAPVNAGPRKIDFSQIAGDGNIDLVRPLGVEQPFVTIDGSTAPGAGIGLRGHGFAIGADHVIVRYLRFRPGALSSEHNPGGRDCITVKGARHVIIDHCSASYCVDELLGVGDRDDDTDNVTVQWSLFAHPLHNSVHAKGGKPHGFGTLLVGQQGSRYNVHHCLFAHMQRRAPRVACKQDWENDGIGAFIDFRNNVVHHWGNPANENDKPEAGISYDEKGKGEYKSILHYNLIRNDYRPGNSTAPAPKGLMIMGEHSKKAVGFFLENVMWDGDWPSLPADQWSLVEFYDFSALELTVYQGKSGEWARMDQAGTPAEIQYGPFGGTSAPAGSSVCRGRRLSPA